MINLNEIALNRLTNQFSESQKLRALIETLVKPLQTVCDGAEQLKLNRWIDTAVGKQLDGCGYIVGEKRLGRDDSAYREAIRFRVFVNTSNGTPSDLITGVKVLTYPDDIQYIEQYPATAMVFTDGVIVPSELKHTIQDISPTAISDVQILLSYGQVPFRFSGSPEFAELFVNNDAEYLTIDGSDFQLSSDDLVSGPTLGGLAATDYLLDDGSFLSLDDGSELVFNDSNSSIVLESGYHLTGVL